MVLLDNMEQHELYQLIDVEQLCTPNGVQIRKRIGPTAADDGTSRTKEDLVREIKSARLRAGKGYKPDPESGTGVRRGSMLTQVVGRMLNDFDKYAAAMPLRRRSSDLSSSAPGRTEQKAKPTPWRYTPPARDTKDEGRR